MPKSEPQLALAWVVRKLRTEKGLTQEALALEAELHLTWIGRLEAGVNPTWATTMAVALALGTTHGELAMLADQRRREEDRDRGTDAGP